MSQLPPRLVYALNRWHAEPNVWQLAHQLELFGCQVSVRRLQLGDTKAEEFGKVTEIYRTGERGDE